MSTPPDPNDPLALTELFAGGAEPWLPLLEPVIERQPGAFDLIGPGRAKTVVPVRELTFQALKPNPPENWKVVVFGQNPYPRVESATGIAMFDNTFHDWKDSQFGKVTSIRCIIKAACMWKHAIPKQTSTAQVRTLLAKNDVVQPPAWFQAMLAQGVLLLNAALTASSDESLSTAQHTAFWRPVVEKIVEEILRAKQNSADARHKGVVFAWWGAHARALRTMVEGIQRRYPGVPVKHVDHCNPAAQGDMFCDGTHFADLNAAVGALGMDPVDWLPSVGWEKSAQSAQGAAEDSGRMGEFISKTMELHKFYLERLGSVADEKPTELAPIAGVMASPSMPFTDAVAPLEKHLPGVGHAARGAAAYARQCVASGRGNGLSEHEVAALHLYTMASQFYRELNATLRHADRARAVPYYPYLRLFFSALGKLSARADSLYRGVRLDLRAQYPKGGTVVWWGVSSCTTKASVAHGFMGSAGRRTLFEIKPASAVSIKAFSAFTGEEEYVLAPGTRLKVVDVTHTTAGLSVVKLEELVDGRMVG